MAEIGEGCRLPHSVGIVIGRGVRIGNNVTLYQHVTLGSHGKPNDPLQYPVVDDDVTIYAGAVIIGPVYIGKGAIIGAGAVVLDSVPAYSIVAGMPARVIRQLGPNEIKQQHQTALQEETL